MPDETGHFGNYGGRYIAETLISAVEQLEKTYKALWHNSEFQAEFDQDLAHYVGRPSPLYHAKRWSQALGGAQVYLKREDLNHTGAHKINHALGQALLARHMGKTRIITETGAGQHGVASATVAARLGLKCHVYMGAKDIKRQSLNVYRMKLLGAEVIPVEAGSQTLKDAINEALRDWVAHPEDTFYILGTVCGPHPYPEMVRNFQSVIGREARAQCLQQTGFLPDVLVACVGGGSNAMGLFYEFINDETVQMIGVEAGGKGINSGKHAARMAAGNPGVLQGNRTYLMSDDDGQIIESHSISAGLDYPGVGPEHSYLKDIGRVQYVYATDDEALSAFQDLTLMEGIIPALETAHALAYIKKLAPTMNKNQTLIVNLSGRGDKDIHTIAELDGIQL
ncbi:MAG: tryptophan synthase subunit beta [Endozoicomonas sp. (ex Botrylloides leachii)]|nr:tryptophan synthase subunit beta [Endozoicomonas sp. (ex Botrylloides leachii)]